MAAHCKSLKSMLNKIDDVMTCWWCHNDIISGIQDLKGRPNTCSKNSFSDAGSITSSSFTVPEITATQDWWCNKDIIKELKQSPSDTPEDYLSNAESIKSLSFTVPMIATKQD